MTLMFWSTHRMLDPRLVQERVGEGDQHRVVAAQKLDHRRDPSRSPAPGRSGIERKSRGLPERGGLCHRVALCGPPRRLIVLRRTRRTRLGVVLSFEESPAERALISPLVEATAAGMEQVNRLVIERTSSDVALIPGGGALPDRFRRQAAPAHGDDRLRRRLRLSRRSGGQARGERRVHAHRDALPRRCGRRKRNATRQAGGAACLGQPGERARRRFPARPGFQDDGRRRLARGARGALRRRRDDRRGRGDAAHHSQEHRDDRGRISRCRRAPRRRCFSPPRPRWARSSRAPTAASGPPSAPSAPISASPSS